MRDPRTGRRRGRPSAPDPLVVAGAQPWEGPPAAHRPRVGALLLHGFTGSPASVRPWGEALASAGLHVAVPRLPGHGTSVADLDRTTWHDWYALARADLLRLRERCDVVLVGGLSMGGALALRLAVHEAASVDALALVNPAVLLGDPRLAALPLLRLLRRDVPGVADDVVLEGRTEVGYDRVPLRALSSFVGLMAGVREELPRVRQPLLVASSAHDRVVPTSSAALVRTATSSRDVRDVRLPRSGHVATLDHDAPLVVAETLRLARDVAGSTGAGSTGAGSTGAGSTGAAPTGAVA
ncbi:alpha/beta fold hydrolase [Pseudokineococcus marinus]|uniref:Alpha/beta fold hydrolase n=1 Tax=Pseudokineococcus marinus TaxID=351215 RepID=A0A849BQN5_9ACTN|nr:alpha/beta fold hydrolase [Pseudokineococcus marinus]